MKNSDDDVFEMDMFDGESLFENFTIDLDFDFDFFFVGMVMVDYLNVILVRYSDNVFIKGFEDNDFLFDVEVNDFIFNSEKILESLRIFKGSIKFKELEVKIVLFVIDIRKKKCFVFRFFVVLFF